MAVLEKDKATIRKLATELAEIAHLPIQKQEAEMWRRLNRLEPVKVMVWINESPWADCEEAAANIGEKYVLSLKPNPAILAAENWNLDAARQKLEEDLEKTKGCAVEVIMKDISTCRRQPHRLWEWANIATKLTERY